MRGRRFLAGLLTAVMSASSIFSVPLTSVAAGEDETQIEASETAGETEGADATETADGTVSEEPEYVRVEEGVEEEVTQPALIGNLAKYMPEDAENADEDRLPVTGITPIMPCQGEVNTLVIMTEFKDHKFAPEFKKTLSENVFRPDSPESVNDPMYPKESLRAYYQRASFGQLDIKGEIIDYQSEHERSWYQPDVNGTNDPLYQEVLNYWAGTIIESKPADSGLSDLAYLNQYLSKFDADGDMRIDGCYVAVAGGHNGWANQWWAYRTGGSRVYIGSYMLPSVIQVIDTMHTEEESAVPGDDVEDYITTFIHETGHQLGLDDYYSYESDLQKINTFAMMSTNAGDQDGFAKMLLGWLPEGSIQWVDEDGTIELSPYAESGDVALILPKEEKAKYGVYSQFILAEYYTPTRNDIVDTYNRKRLRVSDNSIITLDQPEPALRMYHVYARLNGNKTEFIASNPTDSKIPLITNYWCKTDKAWGFFRSGDEMTPDTDPNTAFYSNPSGDGQLRNTTFEDTGISITDVTTVSGNKLRFKVDFAEDTSKPQVKDVTAGFAEKTGPFVQVVFDRAVNVNKDSKAEIFDLDTVTGEAIPDEKWGAVYDVKRDLQYDYTTKTDTVYFMLSDVRYTDGVLVLPKGMISTTGGVPASETLVPFSFLPAGMPELSASKAAGRYDDAVEVELSLAGAPEGTTIVYTLDGSEPTSESEKYTSAVKIEKNATLKAIAFTADGVVSKRFRAEYIIEKVSLAKKEITLAVGEYFFLNPELFMDEEADPTLTYESSNVSCVSVYEGGILIAKAEGTADITVKTKNGASAVCKVTVSKDAAGELEALFKEKYGDAYSEMMEELSMALRGSMTFAEFYASDLMKKRWVGFVDSQEYSGKALKPDAPVYDGYVRLEQNKDYKLSYKNNKNAGTAQVKVSFKGTYKKEKALTGSFVIEPKDITYTYFFTMGVKANGKEQKPKPILVDPDTGAQIKLKDNEFTMLYYDEEGHPVSGVKDEGIYYVFAIGKGGNYVGSVYTYVRVQKNDLVEKLKVKKKTKSFKYTGEPITPQYGKDFTIKAPKGYDEFADKDGNLNADEIGIYCFNNVMPGKMIVLITDQGMDGHYFGTQIVTFNIKK